MSYLVTDTDNYNQVVQTDNYNQVSQTDSYYQINVETGVFGFSLWFLPSQDLCKIMTQYFYDNAISGSNYWSSSEFNATRAIYLRDLSGTATAANTPKNFTQAVRAVRSFIAPEGAYSIGDDALGGGKIFHIIGTTYYEYNPVNQATSVAWSNIDTLLIGTTGTAIGTGAQNTLDIIGQAGHTNSAAKLCNDLN
jgi:hypothetical protein